MNASVVRASIYSLIIGMILGAIIGFAAVRLDWIGAMPSWYFDEIPPSPLDGWTVADTVVISLEEEFDLSGLAVPREEIQHGGPPKDGIPAITDPQVVPVTEADFLSGSDRIVGVKVNDESRAYPIRLLNWHEIVNDEIADVPIAVVYCPLCDSVTVVDRRINGDTLEFGVSGFLYQSNVLMYDRKHDALWSQIMLEAISGPYVGQSLTHLPGWAITTIEQWERENPNGTVASFDTDHPRDYELSPYARYMESDGLWFPLKREDERLPRKHRVIGVRYGDVIRAYPVDAVYDAPNGRVIDTIAGSEIILEADGKSGHTAVVKAPEGAQTIHTFWFSWASTHPKTEIFGKE